MATEEQARAEKFDRQTREQYEALGRFVQSFESVVSTIRVGCQGLGNGGIPGIAANCLRVVWHDQTMTPAPLWRIYRAMTSIYLAEHQPAYAPQEIIFGQRMLAKIDDRLQKLISRRNNLLHGTWLIGYVSDGQQDFAEMGVYKRKVTSAGLGMTEMPKSAADLIALTNACGAVQGLIQRFDGALAFGRGLEKNCTAELAAMCEKTAFLGKR